MTAPLEDRSISGIKRMGLVAWSLLGTMLLLAAVGWVLLRFRILLPAVVLAVAVVYVLNPVVTWLQGKGLARWMGSCLSYLVVGGVLTLLGFLAIPSLVDQGRDLAADFPRIYDDLAVDAENLASNVGLTIDVPDYQQLKDQIDQSGGEFVSEQFGRITDLTLTLLEGLVLLLIAPVVAFYALLDLPTVRRKVMELIPERHRAETRHVAGRLGTAVGGFLRGQVLVAVILGVMTSVGFWAIDLPFWLLIGMIAGFLNIIPLVGPWVGGILGVLMALATRDLTTAVYAGLIALVVQQIDNHFISPTVLRATVRIHPAMIILGLIGGATIGGFWGVVLAVPTMAMIKILAGHFWRTRVLGQSWEEASEALIAEPPGAPVSLLARIRRGARGGTVDPAADGGEAGPAEDPPAGA
ncbi:MAG: AI-2E family transporter [Actinobacteria bacterium]|nr:AI-2E family transporter [Actinomycetota bacterium]